MSHQQELEYASSVLGRVEKVRKEGKLPLVALDLDLTLFDNRPRTRHILQDLFMGMWMMFANKLLRWNASLNTRSFIVFRKIWM